jgi:hypothetical protein
VVNTDADPAHLADLHYGVMQGARVPVRCDSLNVTVAADQACRIRKHQSPVILLGCPSRKRLFCV